MMFEFDDDDGPESYKTIAYASAWNADSMTGGTYSFGVIELDEEDWESFDHEGVDLADGAPGDVRVCFVEEHGEDGCSFRYEWRDGRTDEQLALAALPGLLDGFHLHHEAMKRALEDPEGFYEFESEDGDHVLAHVLRDDDDDAE